MFHLFTDPKPERTLLNRCTARTEIASNITKSRKFEFTGCADLGMTSEE
jgi:hypothetical protein